MKETVKKIVVGVMALATATTFFVGCTNSTETQSDTSSSSSYSEIIDTPGVPADTAPEFSVQFKYWYDTVTESFESEGDEFIVSGRTPIYASEGQFAPNDLYRHFRIEGTGERIYAISPASAEEIGGKFQAILDKSGKEQLTTLADRIKSTEKLEDALKSDTVYNVFANNMETGIS